jgi:hypothetical protein
MNPSQGLKAPTLQMVRVGIIKEIVVKLLHELALQFIYLEETLWVLLFFKTRIGY